MYFCFESEYRTDLCFIDYEISLRKRGKQIAINWLPLVYIDVCNTESAAQKVVRK